MDINMPEMNGIEATAAIRQLPGSLASIPIIAMTALAMPGDREKLLSQGMDDYVSKPINREELYECISNVLNDHGLAAVNNDNVSHTGMAVTDMSIIDLTALGNLKEDVGAELLPEIIDTYLSELSDSVKTIAAAAERGDCERVAAEAHSLKSSSAYFGAMAMAELARQLERAAQEQDLENFKLGALNLPGIFQQTRDGLLKVCSEISAGQML
jgi:CheY-like chemotaxis protein